LPVVVTGPYFEGVEYLLILGIMQANVMVELASIFR